MKSTVQTPAYKFVIADSDKRVQLTAINNISSEVFQSDWCELEKISSLTISAALKKENPFIRYEISDVEGGLALTVSVEYDFLPKISEQLSLPLVLKEAQIKIELISIAEQLKGLEQELEKVTRKTLEVHQVPTIPWEKTFPAGRRLVQFSGSLAIGGSEYYDENGNAIISPGSVIVRVYEGEGKILSEQEFPVKLSFQEEGYDTPFKMTAQFNLKKEGKLSISMMPENVSVWGCLLTITSL